MERNRKDRNGGVLDTVAELRIGGDIAAVEWVR